jgi:ABC-type iron transport system FetAB ATPase subunit
VSRLRVEELRGPGVAAATLTIGAATCVAVYGPSGGGKTRLLRALADLDPCEGDVWLDDRERRSMSGPEWRRRVGFLAADSQWWDRTVGSHAADWDPATLGALGFDASVLAWEVARLSSGERQRLALARALARDPAVLLLDEPTANLDRHNTARVEQVMARWRSETSGAALWVSHDAAQRARVASRSHRIDGGVLRPADD